MHKLPLNFIAKLTLYGLLFCGLCACDNPVSQVNNNVDVAHEQPVFVGSSTCSDCHQEAFTEWQQSHHFQAMRAASNDAVLADFNEVTVTAHEVTYRFYTRMSTAVEDGKDKGIKDMGLKDPAQPSKEYWVSITENQLENHYQIKFTFGYFPLQQYLIELEHGHIQALNMSWDARPSNEGGQRWFHLRPDESMSKDNIFHWQRHYQNWNARCADCHSTGLEKNYDAANNSYQTTWSEINVACEACHGAASQHVSLAQQSALTIDNTGFSTSTQMSLDWQYDAQLPIAIAQASDRQQTNEIDMCGACHSLRSRLAGANLAAPSAAGYHDDYRLQIVDEVGYFADGQIKQETFVLGSFLQSKMHASGVTCANCHNPHTGKVLIEGNGLCLQCHSPTAYDNTEHHAHEIDTAGSQCVNCHMPARTYMQVDARRDHSFIVPDLNLSTQLESPYPCLSCHDESFNSASRDTSSPRHNDAHWALLRQAYLAGEEVLAQIKTYLNSDPPVMHGAALLSSLAVLPTQASFDVAKLQLENDEPLMRRASVSAFANLPLSVRTPTALKMMQDPVRAVRFEALLLLLGDYQALSAADKHTIAPTLAEYQSALNHNADSPEGQMAMANLALSQLDFVAAEQAYDRALHIEPNYLPTLINLADYYRATNRDELGRVLLQRAIALDSKSSTANFSYAMSLIRIQEKQLALEHLRIATEQADSTAYYHYVFAVGLHDQGQADKARQVVANALFKWPADSALIALSQQLKLR